MIFTHHSHFSYAGKRFPFDRTSETDRQRASEEVRAFAKKHREAVAKQLGRDPTPRELARSTGANMQPGPAEEPDYNTPGVNRQPTLLEETEQGIANLEKFAGRLKLSPERQRELDKLKWRRDQLLQRQSQREAETSEAITQELLSEQRDPRGDIAQSLTQIYEDCLTTGRGGIGYSGKVSAARQAFESGDVSAATEIIKDYTAICEADHATD